MFRRRFALAAAACGAALACGERFGEPIVATTAEQGGAAAPTGGAAGSAGSSAGSGMELPAGGDGGEAPLTGPLGLCATCSGSEACGDTDDACLRQGTDLFCGRDCDEAFGCPDGYQCVPLENVRLWQCVPNSDCPDPAVTPPPISEIRAYVLDRINAERDARDRAPLSSSSCLDDLAQASAVDYAYTEMPSEKFDRECGPIWPNCACGWRAQAEIAVAVWGLDWTRAIEHALGGDQLLGDVLDPNSQGVGIGFWISGDEAWIALSFR